MNLFLESSAWAAGIIVVGALFVVAVNDLADEESTTSRLTKTLEWVVALAMVALFCGAVFTGIVSYIRWVST